MLSAGDTAPDFSLEDLDGNLRSRNGAMLLVFFKVTCPTCQLAFPFLQRLAGQSHVPVVAISQDDAAATRTFNSTYGIRIPTLIDPASGGYAVSNSYRITHVPSLFLIGEDGVIESAGDGFDKAALENLAKLWNVEVFTPDDRVPLFKPG